jgi:hypothetical protein
VSLSDIGQRLNVPTMVLGLIASALEKAGLLAVTESEALVPGQEMSRIRLQEILDVVRAQGEPGYQQSPSWGPEIDLLGGRLDAAVHSVVADKSLADLLDEIEDKNLNDSRYVNHSAITASAQ